MGLGEWSVDPLRSSFSRNAIALGDPAGERRVSLVEFGRPSAPGQRHPQGRANIAAHYDLGNDFYAAWLDSTMTYSSAWWSRTARSKCQRYKIERLLDRLKLKHGDRLSRSGAVGAWR